MKNAPWYVPVRRNRYTQPAWVKFRYLSGDFGIAVMALLEPALLEHDGEVLHEDLDVLAFQLGYDPEDFEAVIADAIECGILVMTSDRIIIAPNVKDAISRHMQTQKRKGLNGCSDY
jgi:hypothetical protein